MKRTVSRTIQRSARLILLMGFCSVVMGGCAEEEFAVEEEEALSLIPVAAPAPLRVTLSAEVEEGLRRGPEVAGLLLALMELGLSDLEGVVPSVQGLPASPGLLEPLEMSAVTWRGHLKVGPAFGQKGSVWAALELCDPDGDCVTSEVAAGTTDEPTPAAAALLREASDTLGRMPLLGTSPEWAEEQSSDPYAVLMAGRAAAVWYGLLPPLDEALVGDKRRDPLSRAGYLDPYQPVVAWLIARRGLMGDNLDTALFRMRRAALGRPGSVTLLAGIAATLTRDGQRQAAWRAWTRVKARSPGDLRYMLPMVEAALDAGEPQEALALLTGLSQSDSLHPRAAALRVAVADALGRPAGYDELLALWAEADPSNPEPLRRRVRLRVADGRYAEALALSDGLHQRGAAEEAIGMAIALEAAMGRWQDAAGRAARAGRDGEAARLRARGALEAGGVAALEEDNDPVAQVLTGEGRLRAGSASEALARANYALQSAPWYPPALALRAAALEARGEPSADAWAALAFADPLGVGDHRVSLGLPRTVPGSTAVGSQSQPTSP